jgi:uncharacterized protein (DUF58 family)
MQKTGGKMSLLRSFLNRVLPQRFQQGSRTPLFAFGKPSTASTKTSSSNSSNKSIDVLDSATLSKIGGFELLAQTVVDGVMSGKHRSTHKGGCCEFSEHRPYTQGDEVRLIDWRLFGRRDQPYVKLFDDETNLHAWLVLDSSSSMKFGDSTMSKFDFARTACACLGRLLLRQRDSIGLVAEIAGKPVRLPPKPQATHFHAVCDILQRAAPAGKRQLTEVLSELPSVIKRRGMVMIFSDCFGDVDKLASELKILKLRGHDVIVFQILAPEEMTFSFRNSAIFEDLENVAPRLKVNPGQVRRRYLERFDAFQEKLRTELRRANCDLCTISTGDDLGEVLTHFLSYRAARKKSLSKAGA